MWDRKAGSRLRSGLVVFMLLRVFSGDSETWPLGMSVERWRSGVSFQIVLFGPNNPWSTRWSVKLTLMCLSDPNPLPTQTNSWITSRKRSLDLYLNAKPILPSVSYQSVWEPEASTQCRLDWIYLRTICIEREQRKGGVRLESQDIGSALHLQIRSELKQKDAGLPPHCRSDRCKTLGRNSWSSVRGQLPTLNPILSP